MTRFLEGPGGSPGFLLWHVTLTWQRKMTAVLGPLDLTHVQFVLLACAWWLQKQGEPPNQLQLSRQAGIDVRMTSQVVRRLEAKGLLERAVDRADTRARRLTLTVAGIRLAQRAIVAVEEVDAEFFGDHAATITPVLRQLIEPAEAPVLLDRSTLTPDGSPNSVSE